LNIETQIEVKKDTYSVDEFEKTFDVDVALSITDIAVVNPSTGNKAYFCRIKDTISKIDEVYLQKQNAIPLNREQKVFSTLCLSPKTDIVICAAKAGSGKTIQALSSACMLLDEKGSNFEKILYIRKTIVSIDNKQEELGFLPGTLEEKMGGYLAPLFGAVEKLVRRKYKSADLKDKENLDSKIKEFISKYRIETAYEGFLRGTTIDNAVVILDEFQNESTVGTQLILSRMGQNTKVIAIGHTGQIDNSYVNEMNNGLTYLVNECEKTNDNDVTIVGCRLLTVVRSKIAEFGDSIKTNRR